MKIVVRIIVGLHVGAFGGGILGAIVFNLYALPSLNSTDRFGTMSTGALVLIGAIEGAVYGLMPGTVIGFVVGATGIGRTLGALIGVGTILAFSMFLMIQFPNNHEDILRFTIMAVPAGAVVGTLVGTANRWLRQHRVGITERTEQIVGREPR